MLSPIAPGTSRPRRRALSAVVSACLLFSALLSAGPPEIGAIDETFTARISSDAPGAAVLVRKDGRTILARGYGLADLDTGAAISPHTNFRLASLTKQFTAMAVMLLVQDGKLTYEQNLAEIFPGFPEYGRAITVRHLLTHTSGLADYETLMAEKEKTAGRIWSRTHQIHDDEVFALLAQQSHGVFAPGTSWSYSNSGYVILGLIVAKVSRMPFPDFLRMRIFRPLKMLDTVVYRDGNNIVHHRALGYTPRNGSFEDTDQSETSATLGDGGIYSNLDDLARWDEALSNGKLLSTDELAAAWKPVRLNGGGATFWPDVAEGDNTTPGKPVSYGFGWFLSPIEGHLCVWHFGSTSGFRTMIQRFYAERVTIIILENRTDLDPGDLARRVLHAVS